MSLYKSPIKKRTADLQWRLVHGIIATNRHAAHLNPALGKECPFCGVEETVDHLFINCIGWKVFFIVLKNCFEGLSEDFSNQHFISGPKSMFQRRRKVCSLNFLLRIWKTRTC